jgi:hypothetical protein
MKFTTSTVVLCELAAVMLLALIAARLLWLSKRREGLRVWVARCFLVSLLGEAMIVTLFSDLASPLAWGMIASGATISLLLILKPALTKHPLELIPLASIFAGIFLQIASMKAPQTPIGIGI